MKKAPYDLYDYTEFWHGRDYENQSEKIALDKFLHQINKTGCLIDIGGGYGRLASSYSHHFNKCVIADPSSSLLQKAKINLKKNNFFDFVCCEANKLPKEKYDVAMMVRVAHHIPDLKPTFEEVSRILEHDGYFILEYANKIHFLSILRSVFSGNLNYLSNIKPIDIRSEQAKKENKIIFVDHHPKKVEELLIQSGFKIVDKLSVSNFRHPRIKKIVPEKILLFLENILQKPLSNFNFGPSIFLLCQKQN